MRTPLHRRHFESLLFDTDTALHTKGWDNDDLPQLCTMELLSADALAMTVVPVKIPGPTGDSMSQLGKLFLSNAHYPQALLTGRVGIYMGTALISEAWMTREGITREELAQIAKSGRSLGDTPGSVEARMIVAVDIWGRSYQFVRVRGKDPMLTPPNGHGGKITQALVDITLATVRALPGHAQNEAMLKSVNLLRAFD